MQLLPDRPPSLIGNPRSFRTSPWAPGLALVSMLVFGGLFVRLAGPAARGLPWFVWILAGPMLGVVGAVMLLAAGIFLHAWLDCFRGTNWIMTVAPDGLYLNLRSYLNADYPIQDPTVVFVPFSEIDSAAKITERWEQRRQGGSEIQFRCYLELSLARVDTTSLSEAVRQETGRTPRERSSLGVKTRTKAIDIPVFVPSPGTIRVQWRRGMLSALEGRVRIVEARRVDLTRKLTPATTEERCLALLRRGEKIAAVETARAEFGVDLAEARQRVERLEKHVA